MGRSGFITLTLRVPLGIVPYWPSGGQLVTNTAQVTNAGQALDLSTVASSYINALAPASTVHKSGPSTALLNAAGTDDITHTITVCPQPGHALWQDYVVTDTLPPGVTIVTPLALPLGGVYIAGTASTSVPGPNPGDPPIITPGTGGTIVWHLTPSNRPSADAQGCLPIVFQVNYVNAFAGGDLTNVIGNSKTNSVSAVGSDGVGGSQNIGPATTTLTLNGPVTRFSPSKSTGGNYYVENGAPDNAVTYQLGAANTSDAQALPFSSATLTDGPFPAAFTLNQIDTGTWTGAVATVAASIETSPDGSTWTQVSSAPSSAISAGLGGVRYVRWIFTSVGAPAIGPGWTASAQHLVGVVSGAPPIVLTNCAALSGVQSGVTQDRGAACADVSLETPQPHPSITKTAPSTLQPGETITYTLVAANNIDATDVLVNPLLTDCVPDSAHLVVGNLRAGGVALPANGWSVVALTPSGCTATLPNAVGAGTLVKLQYAGSLVAGTSAPTITYDVTADGFQFPTINDAPTVPGLYTNTVKITEAGGADFGHCVQPGCTATHTATVPIVAQLDSNKMVRGALDVDFNKAGTTTPGGQVTWQLTVQNKGNTEVEQVDYIDVFGYIGDTGVVRTDQQRGSEYAAYLTSPIVAPIGWTVEYSLSNNPCRPEVLGPNTGCTAPNWVSVPDPLLLPLYRSIRLHYEGRIAIGGSLSFQWDMVTPVFDPSYDTPSTTTGAYDQLQSCTIPDSTPPYNPLTPSTTGPGNSTLVGSRTEVAAWVDNGAGGGTANDGVQQVGEGGPTCPRSSNNFAYGVHIPADQRGGLNDPGRLGAQPPKVDLFVAATALPNVIGDRVWEDFNNNGIQDNPVTEPGIPYVRVELYGAAHALVDVTFTDLNGNYLFGDLPDGVYTVRFYMPDSRGYISPQDVTGVTPDAGASNTNDDSDIPQSPTGTLAGDNFYESQPVTLGVAAAPEADLTWDAGIWIPKPAITLKKYVNGNDAQTAPGVHIPKGAPVTWTYDITNTGNSYLNNVSLTDVVTISGQPNPTPVCNWAASSDPLTPANVMSRGETVSCTASGLAITGQYGNLATVVATPTLDDGITAITGKVDELGAPLPSSVMASDPAHYFGVVYDLALVKTVGAPTVAPDGTITWTVSVKNQGNVASGAYTVTDAIPAGLAVAAGSTPPTSNAGPVYQWVMPSLTPGATVTITINTTITDVNKRPFRNWAEISADSAGGYGTVDDDSVPDANVGNDTGAGTDFGSSPNDVTIDQTTLPAVQHNDPAVDEDDSDFAQVDVPITFDLALRKTVNPVTVTQDGLITWTITVYNQGNVDSGNVIVRDTMPAGITFGSSVPDPSGNPLPGVHTWSIANVAPGATATIVVTTSATDLKLRPFRNWAEISVDSANLYSVPGYPVIKDIDSTPDTNTGSDAGAGTGLDPNDAPYIDDEILKTPATGDEDDNDLAEVGSNVVYDLALVKVANSPTATVGIDPTWTVRVFNQGNVRSGQFQVTDKLPTGLTFVSGSVATSAGSAFVGANCTVVTFTVTCTVPGLEVGDFADVVIVSSITGNNLSTAPWRNWAEISSDSAQLLYGVNDLDSLPDTNTGRDNTLPNDAYQGIATIAATYPAGNALDEDDNDDAVITNTGVYDLALAKTASAAVIDYDQIVTFTITVQNQGTLPSGAYTITDWVPAGLTLIGISGGTYSAIDQTITWTMPNLVAGASTTKTYTASIADINKRPFRNVAEISSDSARLLYGIDDVDSSPDLDASNDGTYPAIGAVPGTGIDNLSTNDAGVRGGDPQDDADIADVTANVVYDLALAKVVDATDLATNGPDVGTATFTVTVANQGTVPSHTFTITDWVPVGIEPVLPIGGSGVWSSAARTITWPMSDLLPGVITTRSYVVTISDISQRPYRNIAEISADSAADYSTPTETVLDTDSVPNVITTDDGTYPAILSNPGAGIDNLGIADAGVRAGDPQDDADIADLTYPVIYDLALAKVSDGPAVVLYDDTIQFTITVQNQGNVKSHDFTVNDTLPPGLSVVDAGGGTIVGGSISWVIANLDPGQITTITFTTRVADITLRPYRNVAEISLDSADDYDARGIDGAALIDIEDVDSTPDAVTTNDGAYPPLLDVPVPGTGIDNLIIGQAGTGADAAPIVASPPSGGQDDADIADVGVDVRYDLALAKVAGAASVAPDGSVVFTITVKNEGTVPSGDFTVTDTLPVGMAATAASDGGDISVAGLVSWSLTGLNPGQERQVTVTSVISDLSKRPFKNIAEISADSAASYSTDTVSVSDVDSLPNSDTTDDNGESGTGSDGYGTQEHPTNDIIVIGGPEGGEDDADVAFVDSPVLYDLALVKTGPAVIDGNGAAVFTITVKNQGNVGSGEYSLLDTIPVGLTAVSASSGGVITANTVTWNLGNLAAGATTSVTLTLRIADFTKRPWVNYAEVATDGADVYDSVGYELAAAGNVEDADSIPNSDIADDVMVDQTVLPTDQFNDPKVDEDDHDIAPITAFIDYDLALVKILPSGQSYKLGSNITFNIVVKNQGNVDSGPVSVRDVIPAGLTFVSTSGAGLNAAQTVVWEISNLAPNETRVFSLVVRMDDITKSSYVNYAEIISDGSGAYSTATEVVTDADSFPDSDITNDLLIDTDDVDTDFTPGDEDDHDRALLDPNKVVVDNEPPPVITIPQTGGSSTVPLVGGSLLLVGLGAIALLVAHRRRRPAAL